MCGIVGCVGQIWKGDEDAFKTLLILDTIRGPHSTGVFGVANDPKAAEIAKAAGTPYDLFATKEYTELMRKSHRLLIGHNRYATVGGISEENAHPFHHGKFWGVHNGTIRNQHVLKDHSEHDVDSSNVYYNMEHEGVEATLAKIKGAFAFVFYNSEDHTVNFVRNSERPLFLTRKKDGKTIFWASEAWMLEVALARHKIEHDAIVELPVGQLGTITVPGYSTKDMENFKPRFRTVQFCKESDYWDDYWDSRYGGGSSIRGSNYYNRDGYGNYSRSSYGVEDVVEGKESTNIVPFVRQGVGSKKLAEYVDHKVYFTVIGERTTNGMNYILCETDDKTQAPIRIFLNKGGKVHKKLMNSSMIFSALVKKVTCTPKHGSYLVIRNNSIEEEEDTQEILNQRDGSDDGNLALFYPAYGGELLTSVEWHMATIKGCGWCSDPLDTEDAAKIRWIDKNTPICPHCKNSKEINEMYGAM